MILRWLLPVLFLTIAPVLVSAQMLEAKFDSPVALSPSASSASGPTVRARGGDVFVSYFVSPVDVYFTHSADGGKSFGSSVLVSKGKSTNSYFGLLQRSPKFAFAPDGSINLLWLEDRGVGPDLNFTTSTDNGMTWSMARSILPADTKTSQDFPAMAIDSAGRIFVSYLETTMSGYMQYRVIRSDDGGLVWSAPSTASQLPTAPTNAGTCECCLQSMEVSPEGHIYTAWRSNIGGDQRDIFVARSMDLGATWSVIKTQLGRWTVSGCPTTGPKLTLDKAETLHIVWADSRDDSGQRISYYARLPKAANTITNNIALSASTSPANWPAIARNSDGDMEVVFESSSGLYSVVSIDDGATWTSPKRILAGGSDQTNADLTALSSGKFVLAVQDSRNGKSQIFGAIDTANRKLSGVAGGITGPSLALYPNPAKAWITSPIGGSYTIYDMLGRNVGSGMIQTNETISTESLRSGAYTLHVAGTAMRFVRE